MRLFRPTQLFLLFLLGLPPAAQAEVPPPPCGERPCIQVGSFNVEYLGQEREPYEGRDRTSRSRSDVKALADLISRDLDLEAVVLQEIDTASADWRRLSRRLARRGWRFVAGTTAERGQFVVVGWDAGEVTAAPGTAGERLGMRADFVHPDDPACARSAMRRPVAVRLAAGAFDFWLVGVHLKSNSDRGLPAGCSHWIRGEQARELAAEADRLAADGEVDVVLAGDFNQSRDHESLAPLAAAGFAPPDSGPGCGAISYLKPPYESRIDHVLARAAATREAVPGSACALDVPAAERADWIVRRSDHAPVWASFFTDRDEGGP